MRELKNTNQLSPKTDGIPQADLPKLPEEDLRLAMRFPGTPGAPGVVQGGHAPLAPGSNPFMTGYEALRMLFRPGQNGPKND